jgi:hypothetical protein
MFGVVPLVRPTHPLWLDTADVTAQLSMWRRSGRNRILWLSSKDSFFRRLMPGRPQSPQALLTNSTSFAQEGLPYEACLCELSLSELISLPRLYARIKQLLCDRGEILIYVQTLEENPLRATPLALYDDLFPSVDVSSVRFRGNAISALVRKLFFKGTRQFAHRPPLRAVMAAATLLALAPLAWIANSLAARRNPTKFHASWTSAVLHFVVKKKPRIVPETEIGQIGREPQAHPQPDAVSTASVA